MQKWDKELLWNYKASYETALLAMTVTEKLGKLNTRATSVFSDYKMPSRIFAFIESKYSSKIEGIYTTLFDVVNTGIETNQQKIIKPLVESLFREKELTLEHVLDLEDKINFNVSKSNRFEPEFGVYSHGETKQKIYDPSHSKEEVEEQLRRIIDKANNDKNVIEMLHTHILFEKIHPFVDGNGRIGRLILQKSLIKLTNFCQVWPLSWAFLKKIGEYYEAFDINSNEDIDKGVRKLLEIILVMYEQTKGFLTELLAFKNKYMPIVKKSSRTVDDKIAEGIILTLQTQCNYLQKNYSLNPRTVDNIFEYLNTNDFPFNEKLIERRKTYWNIELETLIDRYYN